MKIILRVTGFTPDRESYRKETFAEPKIEKLTKKEQKTMSGEGEALATQLIEIKRVEPVYEFPNGDEELKEYLKVKTEVKLMGCLAKIRSYFDYKADADAGGVKGLKKPFEAAWNVRVRQVTKVGKIIPIGFVRRFQYKGMSGGMGCNRFDKLTEFVAEVDITNPPIEKLAQNIFKQTLEYLESTKLGRSGQIEILHNGEE